MADTHDEHIDALRRTVGRLAGRHLTELVTAGDVVGIAWSRSLVEMGHSLTALPHCRVVQLCGAVPQHPASGGPVGASGVDLVRWVADRSGGDAVVFYAPLVIPDARAARALRTDPSVASAIGWFGRLDVSVIAIGSFGPGTSTAYDLLPENDRRSFRQRGAVAETCGILISADGTQLRPGLESRRIAVGGDDLRRCRDVLCVGYDAARAAAVRATLASGIGTSLVTHSSLARELLAGPARG